jgi:2-iminobutanoate/2-iminopropanoate deaminase
MPREIVSTDKADKPMAHGLPISQATKIGKYLYTAGQVAFHPKTGKVVGSTIEEQTRQALENLKAVVEAAGYSLSDVLKVSVFLKRTSDFAGMNRVYATYFKDEPPARTAVQVGLMYPDLLIELDAVACKD